MFRNFAFELILILFILFVVMSMIPLIELKYHSDLYETIETYNKYCLNNDPNLLNELDVKDTYMWNMTTYIHDFETVSRYLFDKGSVSDRALKDINENNETKGYDYKELKEEDLQATKIYKYYHNMSIPFILFMLLLFGYSMYQSRYLEEIKMCMSGDVGNNANINEHFRYYLYAMAIYIILFITFFGIISKKITEIYKRDDTETYEYIMLMKELDILLKENKITEPDNNKIVEILKKHSKNKINDIRYVALNNKNAMYELVLAQKAKSKSVENVLSTPLIDESNTYSYKNTDDKLIRLMNINRLEYYNSDEAKNKVKGKVADIFRFIYAYVVFLIVPIHLLSVSLKGNYVYLLFSIIVIIVFSISVYNIYNTLQ
jgi:hypothetical protein